MNRYRTFFLFLLLALSGTALAQVPDLTGIGLSGDPAARDTVVSEGDFLYVVTTYQPGAGWQVLGPALDPTTPNYVVVHLYGDGETQAESMGSLTLPIDPASISVDTLSDPRRMSYRVRLVGAIHPDINSLQLEMALLAQNGQGEFAASARWTSHVQAGSTLPLNNPVDDLHKPWLEVLDNRSQPIEITAPTPGRLLPRYFEIHYNLPEQAAPHAFGVQFLRTYVGPTQSHMLWMRDLEPGTDKVVRIDAAALWDTTQFEGLVGANSLVHGGQYRLILFYIDTHNNPFAADTVQSLSIDLRTESMTLYEPRAGTTSPDSSIHVAYDLLEQADSLWVTFTEMVDSGVSM